MHEFLTVLDLIESSNQPMLTRILIALSFLFVGELSAQLPATNIYAFTLTKGGGKYTVKSPQFLTAFNKDGYNNQPAFFNDDVIYFTTNYYDSNQTEIAKFDLYEESLTRITFTEESEYSPTYPGNKEEFSCVRVEKDGKTQTLSIYPIDGIGYAKRYLNNTNNIGYHNWLSEKTVALFLVEEPHIISLWPMSKVRDVRLFWTRLVALSRSTKGNICFLSIR